MEDRRAFVSTAAVDNVNVGTNATMKTILLPTLILLFAHATFADSVRWTGTNISVVGFTAKVTVDLECVLDSAGEGKVALFLQDGDDLLPVAENDQGLDKVRIKRGRQKVKLTKVVQLQPSQIELAVFTPLFPDGQSSSTTVANQDFRLKALPNGKGFTVLNDDEEILSAIEKQLIAGAAKGDYPAVQRALAGGAWVETRDLKGYPVLHVAAANGFPLIVEFLLKKGAMVDSLDAGNGFTALMYAAGRGHSNCVRVLLAHGAAPNAKSKGEQLTALMMAAANNGNLAIIRMLLEKNAEINARSESGMTALLAAAEEGHDEVVKLLLDRGARINSPMINGRTALMTAAENGHAETVRILLANGAEVNAKDSEGNSALMHGALKGHAEVVNLLIQKRANVNAKNAEGKTALDQTKAGSYSEKAMLSALGGDFADPQKAKFHELEGEYKRIAEMLRKAGAAE